MAIAVTWGKKMANIEPAVPRLVVYVYILSHPASGDTALDGVFRTLEAAQEAAQEAVDVKQWHQITPDEWYGFVDHTLAYDIRREQLRG